MKSRQVPFFLYWRYENVQFWTNSIGHLGWLSRISNFPRFHKNVNLLELWKYVSENSSPKGLFDAIKENPNFPSCRGILDIYGQWLLINSVLIQFWLRGFPLELIGLGCLRATRKTRALRPTPRNTPKVRNCGPERLQNLLVEWSFRSYGLIAISVLHMCQKIAITTS